MYYTVVAVTVTMALNVAAAAGDFAGDGGVVEGAVVERRLCLALRC